MYRASTGCELKQLVVQLAGDLIAKPKEIRAFLDQYVIGQDKLKK
jgi:ATP-dependent protease Clp ATPase subunit